MDRKTTKALLIFMQGLSPPVIIEVGTAIKVRMNLKMFVTVSFVLNRTFLTIMMDNQFQIMDFAYKCLALLKTAV